MARNRTTPNPPKTNKENTNMAVNTLSPEQIAELLGSTRSKGDYDTVIDEFIKSGSPGTVVDLSSGALAGKSADNAKTGLDNARLRTNKESGEPVHKGGHQVKVIKRKTEDGEVVALINMAVYGQGAETSE